MILVSLLNNSYFDDTMVLLGLFMFQRFVILITIFTSLQLHATGDFILKISTPPGTPQLSFSVRALLDNIDSLLVSKYQDGYIVKGKIQDKFLPAYLTIKNGEQVLLSELVCLKQGIEKLHLKNNTSNDEKLFIEKSDLPFMRELKDYQAGIKPIIDSLIVADRDFRISQDTNASEDVRQIKLSVLDSLKKELVNRKIHYVKANASSFIGMYFFRNEVVRDLSVNITLSADSLMSIYQTFPATEKGSRIGKLVLSEIEKKKSLGLFSPAPDFSIKTVNNELFKLTDYRGSLVLICFWDTYCAPCIKSLPVLHEIDSLFSGKGFQMISISIDRDMKRWKGSLGRFKPTWRQACDLQEYRSDPAKSLAGLYRIQYIPQYFLMDKNGVIIYHNDLSKDDSRYSVLKGLIATRLRDN